MIIEINNKELEIINEALAQLHILFVKNKFICNFTTKDIIKLKFKLNNEKPHYRPNSYNKY